MSSITTSPSSGIASRIAGRRPAASSAARSASARARGTCASRRSGSPAAGRRLALGVELLGGAVAAVGGARPRASARPPRGAAGRRSRLQVRRVRAADARPLVPVEPAPAQRALDLLDRLGVLARLVGVLDAQHEHAADVGGRTASCRARSGRRRRAGGPWGRAEADARSHGRRSLSVRSRRCGSALTSATAGGIQTAIERGVALDCRVDPGLHDEPARLARTDAPAGEPRGSSARRRGRATSRSSATPPT